MAALVALLALVVVLLGILVAGLLRSHAEILRALHELGVHEAADTSRADARRATAPPLERSTAGTASSISGVSPSGAALSITVAGRTGSTLLAFLSSTCLTCRGFFSAFGEKGFVVPGDARLVVVTKSPAEESPGVLAQLVPPSVTAVMSSDAWEQFGVPVAPYFLLVDGPSGAAIGEGAAATWEQLCDLLGRAAADNGWGDAHVAGAQRLARAEDALRQAGIEPGHPTL